MAAISLVAGLAYLLATALTGLALWFHGPGIEVPKDQRPQALNLPRAFKLGFRLQL